ncbi:MAG: IS1595 family transposase, partial [Elusimicrobia bacterium]|nr:IS1595 family transposase [Elusimicrobiota bacterium]
FNRRTSKSRGMLFYRLVQQAIMINPVHVKNLTS